MFNKGYLGFSFEDIYCIYKEAFFIVLNRGELAMDKGPINVYTQVNPMKSSIAKYNNLSIDSRIEWGLYWCRRLLCAYRLYLNKPC